MSEMVEVVIDSLRVSLMSPQRVVVLRQTDVERYLPIWVGPFEAEAITVALQEVEISRPMTHDLLKNVMTLFNAKVLRVEIVELKEDVFYGNIVAEADGKAVNIELASIGCDCPGSACSRPDHGQPIGDGRGGHCPRKKHHRRSSIRTS